MIAVSGPDPAVKHRIERAFRVSTDACLAQIAADEAQADAPGSGYAEMLRRQADRLLRKADMLMRSMYDEVLGPEVDE